MSASKDAMAARSVGVGNAMVLLRLRRPHTRCFVCVLLCRYIHLSRVGVASEGCAACGQGEATNTVWSVLWVKPETTASGWTKHHLRPLHVYLLVLGWCDSNGSLAVVRWDGRRMS